ncbi:hypothetical protein PSW56_23530, partial [Shigella flexneri]|nr:hypothetical protein [Shigella flexneri]
ERDAFWEMKEKGEAYKKPDHYEEIHSGQAFYTLRLSLSFPRMHHVRERDAFWEMKEKGEAYKKPDHYEEIH